MGSTQQAKQHQMGQTSHTVPIDLLEIFSGFKDKHPKMHAGQNQAEGEGERREREREREKERERES